MSHCPRCSSPVTREDLARGLCPRCGADCRPEGPRAEKDSGAAEPGALTVSDVGGSEADADRPAAEDERFSAAATLPEFDHVNVDEDSTASPSSESVARAETLQDLGDDDANDHDANDHDANDHEVARTLDSVGGPEYVAAHGDGDRESDDEPMATMDSSVVLPDQSPEQTTDSSVTGSSAGSSEAGSAVTMDSVDPAARRLNKLWGSAASESPSPGMTIKTLGQGEGESQQRSISTLTLQKRAVGTSKELQAQNPNLDYDIDQKIGQGGMGMVFSARQSSLDRSVAVKMLRPDIMTNEAVQRKFVSEAVVTGELEHPGIIPVYDMGCSDDGTLFYSMKQVHGTPWSNAIRKKSLHENLEILMKVADAIAFAHSRGVIHRDIKPENVMLGEFGEVLVLDWGLAVSVADTVKSVNISRIANMGGTPAYMAPEMALGPLEDIGKHSDVYLLGAILYECITRRLPRRGKTSTACLMAAARNKIEPTKKKGELVDVALKAMATDPADRYASVKHFQSAIRDYQNHSESITLSTRAARELELARQSDDYRDYSKALFGFEEAATLWEKNLAARDGISSTRHDYADCALRKGDYELGLSLLDEQDDGHRELRGKLQRAQHERDNRLARLKAARRVTFALFVLVFLAISLGSVLIWQARNEAVSARNDAEDSERQAIANADEANRFRLLADNRADVAEQNRIRAENEKRIADRERRAAVRARERALYETYVALIGLAAVKIDERAFDQAIELLEKCPEDQRNWEWGRLKYLCSLRDGKPPFHVGGQVEGVAFDTSGNLVAAISRDGDVMVWRRDGREPVARLKLGRSGSAVAFHPLDSRWLAVGCDGPDNLLMWNRETNETYSLPGHEREVVSVEFSGQNGDLLLTAAKDKSARLWDTKERRLLKTFLGHDSWVWDASFSPVDENVIVTAGEDGTARVWDVRTGEQRLNAEGEPMPFRGHDNAVFTVCFSPDGQYVASGGFDNRVLLWKPDEVRAFDFASLLSGTPVRRQPYVAMEGHTAAISGIEFSPCGNWIMSGGSDNTIRFWSARKQQVDGSSLDLGDPWKTLRGHSSLVRDVAFDSKHSDTVVSGSQDGDVRLWDVRRYEEERYIPDIVLRGHTDAVFMADFAPQGEFVVTASRDRTARSWTEGEGTSPQEYREGHLFLVSSGRYYPDGKRLLTAAGDGTVRVWDAEHGIERFVLKRTGLMGAVALSDSGRWIVTGKDPDLDQDGKPLPGQEGVAAAIWDGDSGQLVHLLRGHGAVVTAIAISPDEKTVFTGDAKGRGNLWDIETATRRQLPARHVDKITAAAFLPDGTGLLTASADKSVEQWTLGQESPRPDDSLVLAHRHGVNSMALAPDGLSVLTGDERGWLELWDRATGESRWRWRPEDDESGMSGRTAVTAVEISADGQRALSVEASLEDQSHSLRVWNLDESPRRPRLLKLFRDRDVWSARFCPTDGEVLILGGDEATALDANGDAVRRYSPHHAVAFASFSPDTTRIVTAAWDGTAVIWDSRTGATVGKLDVGRLEQGPAKEDVLVRCAVYSPDGMWILTATDAGTLALWDADDGKLSRVLARQASGINYASFSSDGGRIIAACDDGAARVYSVADGSVVDEFHGHAAPVLHAAFSLDDSLIVTSGADRVAKVWDARTGSMLCALTGHTDAVTCATFSPDMRRVLTGSRDQTAKLWDTTIVEETGEEDASEEDGAEEDALEEDASEEDTAKEDTAEEDRGPTDEDSDKVAKDVERRDGPVLLVSRTGGEEVPATAPEPEETAPSQRREIGKEILTLRGHHRQAVTSVAFSRDGMKALTSSLDGTAVIWPASAWKGSAPAD